MFGCHRLRIFGRFVAVFRLDFGQIAVLGRVGKVVLVEEVLGQRVRQMLEPGIVGIDNATAVQRLGRDNGRR